MRFIRLSLGFMMLGLLGCAAAPGSRRVDAAVAPNDLTPRPFFRAPGAEPPVLIPAQFLLANRRTPRLPPREAPFIPLPGNGPQFFWPLDGKVRNAGVPHGVEIAGPQGAIVRAARQGQVAVAAQALAGCGPTLILTHDEGYTSVYAGVAVLLVAPGARVAQGSPIARLGTQPLHFEIRHETAPVPVLSLLSSARES